MSSQPQTSRGYGLLDFIFFSNYFYGICAVALSIEAMVQQSVPLDGYAYFFMVFITTTLYYAYPYIRTSSAGSTNPRTNWYVSHQNIMRWNQVIITIVLALALILFLRDDWDLVKSIPLGSWMLIFIFPVVGALYYGFDFLHGQFNLRKIGWLKPFVIGFTWAGLVNVYPVLYYDITHNIAFRPNEIGGLLFLKNFMFITVLCIMFDIKDYAGDYCSRVKTFVVDFGLRKTIFYILIPLSLLGLLTFLIYAGLHQFSAGRILLNVIPLVLLIWVSYSLRKRRSLLYYLVVIDGLMLVKAVCGIIAKIYF